eukprot:TRINITY_DN11724_c0_g1_i1.p1 TRINITY_DN11724_c0_g1~~TRINITY_DN11724_c0_g1_i1.p1  ORF type:complete len:120 (-),score=12.28 TRINITY_DN11724_c0_g1_i1:187-546(-)
MNAEITHIISANQHIILLIAPIVFRFVHYGIRIRHIVKFSGQVVTITSKIRIKNRFLERISLFIFSTTTGQVMYSENLHKLKFMMVSVWYFLKKKSNTLSTTSKFTMLITSRKFFVIND